MGELSPWHWLLVGLVFVLLFGAGRLPTAARSLGRSLRIFKSEVSALHGDDAPAVAPEQAETTHQQESARPETRP
jgi:sec-independent protein translocase protein TatA